MSSQSAVKRYLPTGGNRHWLSAISKIAGRKPTNSDEWYYVTVSAIQQALQVRAILISTRTEDNNHCPRHNLRIGYISPDGSAVNGSMVESLYSPSKIEIAATANGPHRTMHSIASWSNQSLFIVKDNTDPAINRLARDCRYMDEWAAKYSYFLCWRLYDNPIPQLIVSFGSPIRLASRLSAEVTSSQWETLYTLIGARLRELITPSLPQGLKDRQIKILQAEAEYGHDEQACASSVGYKSVRSYRRNREKLATLLHVDLSQLRRHAIQWMIVNDC